MAICSICPTGYTCPNGDIYVCPPGHFCPDGLESHLFPCPPGTFNPITGLSQTDGCQTCPPGMFCKEWGSSAPSGPCQAGYFCKSDFTGDGGECPVGHYCPQGSTQPLSCPAGTYNNLQRQDDCFLCPPGYYCPGNTSDYSVFQCPSGFYCPEGTKHATQFPCPRGFYNPDPNTQSLDSCLSCLPGHYCGTEGLSMVSGKCDPGWFCVYAAWTPQPFDLDNYTSANCLCPATATGGKCQPGFYCPTGTSEPLTCPPGFYCESAGLSAPSGKCSAGFFCTRGAKSTKPLNATYGDICPPGTFCITGSYRPELCPSGTFSSDYGLSNESQCKPCPPGYYCFGTGRTSPSGLCLEGYYCDSRQEPIIDLTQYICLQGYFCPTGTKYGTQFSCPAGTYGARTGLKNITECITCPVGKYCKGEGLSKPSGECSPGYWCQHGAKEENPRDGLSGVVCPPGHYCTAGFYCPLGTGLDLKPCPSGTYSPEPGLQSVTGCKICDGGKFCSFLNATNVTGECFEGYYCTAGSKLPNPEEELSGRGGPCPSGHYCPKGSSVPIPCPLGTYSSKLKLFSEDECTPCPAGHYCNTSSLVEPTGLCLEGFYCKLYSTSSYKFSVDQTGGPCPPGHFCALGSALPQPCPSGTFNPFERQGVCRPCMKGFFCPSSTSSLDGKECPPGFFCPAGTLSAEQFPCPRGTYNPQKGRHLIEHCLPCDPGYNCEKPGQTKVSGPCPAGYYCTGSVETSAPSQGILGNMCPWGHYCPNGSFSPIPCPLGSYSNTSGNIGLADCVLCEPEHICPIGHYCPTGSAEPKACPLGYYQDKIGQSHCIVCPAGKVCPAGYFCVQGTEFGYQHPCPLGTFSNKTGLANKEECSPCPGGSFCATPGLSSPSGLCLQGFYCTLKATVPNPVDSESGDQCPPGYFCETGRSTPSPCPAGTFQPYKGMSFHNSCLPCPAGRFCRGEGLSQISGSFQDLERGSVCKVCPPGFYCESSPLGVVAPLPCLEGHYCPKGSESFGDHKCPAGTFNPNKQLMSKADCIPCPAGFYCAVEGLTQPTGRCLPGYWCIARSQISNPTDGVSGIICPRGKYCVSGNLTGDCYDGYFCDYHSTRPDQKLCPPGFYCPAGTESPLPCDSGSYAPLSGNKGPKDCQPCPSGHFCNALGVSFPKICPVGHFCPPGASFITIYPCPVGTYGPKPGASSKSDCEACPAGMYCSSEGLQRPTGYCYAGYYCSQGAVNPTPITPRIPSDVNLYTQNDICPAGHFCPNGTISPVPCPPGTFSMAAGLSSQEECQPCPAGYYCAQSGLSDMSQALPCSAGYICKEGSSVPCPSDEIYGYRCPAGYYCPTGSSIELPCPPGTFSPMPGASSCLPCPAGSSCMHVSTVEPAICSQGHYCPAITVVPVPCPEGTYNPLEGALSSDSCKICPSGQYCRGEGNWQPDGLCSPGYYCEGEAADTVPQKTPRFLLNGPCPMGHYCPEGTESPKPCPVGTLKNTTGGFSLESCIPCYAGYFCAGVGMSSPTGECSAGFYCPANFTSVSPTAFLCPKGHYCSAGSAYPTPCPTGQHQPNSGSHFCLPCPPGFYCQEELAGNPQHCPPHSYCPSATLFPKPCPNGTFTTEEMNGLRDKGECQPCPPGQYCRGGKLQGPCASGHFCLAGSSEYTPHAQNFSRSSLGECNWGQMCAGICPAGFYCHEGTALPAPCPANTLRSNPGARHREDCLPCPHGYWCKEGNPIPTLCPAGYYCYGVSQTNGNNVTGPQDCPVHTYRIQPGAERLGDCHQCPPGYFCRMPGTVRFQDYPCPPGHWCPGQTDPLPCPGGTKRTEPGAASLQDCEYCPEGHYCPDPFLTMKANIMGIPCKPGYECPLGSVSETICRSGSYCMARTGIPPLCPGGYICPEGSSTYNTTRQLCNFPYYCAPGSVQMISCLGGSTAVHTTGLRDSAEKSCRSCEAGTYRISSATDLSCLPCPAGFSCSTGVESYLQHPCQAGYYCPSSTISPIPCPPGSYGNSSHARDPEHCHPCPPGTYNHLFAQVACFLCGSSSYSESGSKTCICRGLNRAFQESDGSCICQAGYVFYDEREQRRSNSNSDLDCQLQVEKRCASHEIRLASTRKCVSPEHHDCIPFCGLLGGELSPETGICHCAQYVSAEELCDRFCLMRAPHISMSFGADKQFTLHINEPERRRSRSLEVPDVLGPDNHIWRSKEVYFALFASTGLFGVILSNTQVLEAFLTEDSFTLPTPRRQRDVEQGHTLGYSGNLPRIPNPVFCLKQGDVVLFQLTVLSNDRAASHYPVYQKDHLYNTNPDWDFGAFRRLNHLIRDTKINISRFAHIFMDPGTYVFVDNAVKDRSLFVTVKDSNVDCDPVASHVQPSSPYQLVKHGITAHHKLNLAPNWVAIIGVLLLLFFVMIVLLVLAVVLRPSLYSPSPMKNWKPKWRSLGEPYIPPDFQFYESLGCYGCGDLYDIGKKEFTYGSTQRTAIRDLEDFNVRTLYDKLEDQTLHITSQLARHRNETLSFNKAFIQRIQILKETSLKKLLTTSPLTRTLEEIKDALKAKADLDQEEMESAVPLKSGVLIPMDMSKLSPRQFIIYRFGCVIMHLLCHTCIQKPLMLLLAEEIPKRHPEQGTEGFQLEDFYYDSKNMVLFIPTTYLEHAGDFTVLLVHAIAEIKAVSQNNSPMAKCGNLLREYSTLCKEQLQEVHTSPVLRAGGKDQALLWPPIALYRQIGGCLRASPVGPYTIMCGLMQASLHSR
ncbi:hypothetical protein XENTR_v10018612 [Xenopus tropicalis]|nr:hypothetical protein XENTR_v10018612 [Xenopus tropicalis]